MIDLLRILLAPLLWLAAFSAVYGLHGLVCAEAMGGSVFGLSLPRLLLTVAFAFAVLLLAAILVLLHLPRFASASPFVTFVSRASGWVGLIATVWSLLPTVTMRLCV